MNELKEMYDSLTLSNFQTEFGKPPAPAKPDIDYSNETVERLFIQKVNSGHVYEINPDSNTNKLSSLYRVWNVKWKVTGPQRNVTRNNIIEIKGVLDFNQESIKEVRESGFKNVDVVLTNPLEFWCGY